MTEPTNSIQLAFEGKQIRVTPDGNWAAVDTLKAVGQKNPNATWTNLKKQYPELLQESCKYKFSVGRPSDVLTEKGVYKLAMLAKGPRATLFREWAATQLQRLRNADPTLTAELIERTENQDDLRWLAERAKAKESVVALHSAIAEAGCSKQTYPKVNDMNNVAVTGLTAREIQLYRGGKTTRDLYSRAELSLVDTAQTLEVSAIKNRHATGDGEVLGITREVAGDVAALRAKYLGPRKVPHGGILQEEM